MVVWSSTASVPPEGTSLLVLARGVGPVLLHLVVGVVGVRGVVGVVLPSMGVLFGIPVDYFNEVSCEDCEGISTRRKMGKEKGLNKQTHKHGGSGWVLTGVCTYHLCCLSPCIEVRQGGGCWLYLPL